MEGSWSGSHAEHAVHGVANIRHGLDVRVGLRLKSGPANAALVVDTGKGTQVARRVAVVGGRENSAAASLVLFFITTHAHLVTTQHSCDTVELAPCLGDVGTEPETHTALGRVTSWCSLRVAPEQLHHETLLTRLPDLEAVDGTNIVERHAILGEETAVDDKEAFEASVLGDNGLTLSDRERVGQLVASERGLGSRDERGKRQGDEDLRKELEGEIATELDLALTLETVDLVHLRSFVVTTVDKGSLWIEPLVCKNGESNLDRP